MHLDTSNKPMVERALRIATSHHKGVFRRYTNEPYINHPVRVAEMLLLFGIVDQETLCAALLHDCLEDKSALGHTMNPRYITEATNGRVLRWVELLTNSETGNRKARKAKAALRIMNAPWQVQAIKLCDIMDNCKGIAQHDPDFASVYLEEKRNMIGMIRRTPELTDMIDSAKDIVTDETNAVALWRLRTGKEEQAKQVRRDEEIEQIIAAEEQSVYSEVAIF